MLYTLNELRHALFKDVYSVYEVFQNFFGEQYVDLQDVPADYRLLNWMEACDIQESEHEHVFQVDEEQYSYLQQHISEYAAIIVWWPEVTVSNENDKSVQIQDLFARIYITSEGCIPYEYTFEMVRSTFSEVQFSSGYIHSHLPDRGRDLPEFCQPCLGRGPIKSTIEDLHNSNEEALWMLFCQELSIYVTVESLKGIPYRKLEEIGKGVLSHLFSNFAPTMVRTYQLYQFYNVTQEDSEQRFYQHLLQFTDYYLSHGHLALSFFNGTYHCGMPYFDFIIDISNTFIQWFNTCGSKDDVKYLLRKNILCKVFVKEGKFYTVSTDGEGQDICQYEGQNILTFKGHDVNLHILPASQDANQQITLLLHDKLAMFILQHIINIINFHHNNEHSVNPNRAESSEATAPAHKTVCYV